MMLKVSDGGPTGSPGWSINQLQVAPEWRPESLDRSSLTSLSFFAGRFLCGVCDGKYINICVYNISHMVFMLWLSFGTGSNISVWVLLLQGNECCGICAIGKHWFGMQESVWFVYNWLYRLHKFNYILRYMFILN